MVISTLPGVPITKECIIDGFVFQNGGSGISGDGAAIRIYRPVAAITPMISNCLFQYNRSGRGGAIFGGLAYLYDCTFYKNKAAEGGALWTSAVDTTPFIKNCTFFENTSNMGGGAIYHNAGDLYCYNSIFWNNQDEILNDGATFFLSNSIFDDGFENGTLALPINVSNVTSNLDSNPLFVDEMNGNLRLTKNSPAIDQGEGSVIASLLVDLDGHPRFNGVVDMGAYEQPYVNCPDELLLDTTCGPLLDAYFAAHSISAQQGSIIKSQYTATVNAPEVSIFEDFHVEPLGQLEIQSMGCSPPLSVLQQAVDGGNSLQSLLNMGIPVEAFYGIQYQGGLIFYLENDGTGMVASPSDFANIYAWGCYEEDIPGAQGNMVRTGYQNTLDISNATCNTSTSAAQKCLDYSDGTYSDWYLPSWDELVLVYERLFLEGHIVADKLVYFSSTEQGTWQARSLDFMEGNEGGPGKPIYWV